MLLYLICKIHKLSGFPFFLKVEKECMRNLKFSTCRSWLFKVVLL